MSELACTSDLRSQARVQTASGFRRVPKSPARRSLLFRTRVHDGLGDHGRRGGLLVVLAQHAHHGGWRRALALLLASGDDKAAGNITQAQLLGTQVERGGEHRLIGDGGTADRLAPGAGRLVAFQGAVADVLALASGQCGQDGEHHAGRVVRALELAGEELQPDIGSMNQG